MGKLVGSIYSGPMGCMCGSCGGTYTFARDSDYDERLRRITKRLTEAKAKAELPGGSADYYYSEGPLAVMACVTESDWTYAVFFHAEDDNEPDDTTNIDNPIETSPVATIATMGVLGAAEGATQDRPGEG